MSVIGRPSTAVRAGRADPSAPAGLAAALVGLGSLGILGGAVQLAAPGPTHVLSWVATVLLAVAAPLVRRDGDHE